MAAPRSAAQAVGAETAPSVATRRVTPVRPAKQVMGAPLELAERNPEEPVERREAFPERVAFPVATAEAEAAAVPQVAGAAAVGRLLEPVRVVRARAVAVLRQTKAAAVVVRRGHPVEAHPMGFGCSFHCSLSAAGGDIVTGSGHERRPASRLAMRHTRGRSFMNLGGNHG